MIHLRIIPDNQIDNTKVEILARSLSRYEPLFKRWDSQARKFSKQPFISFESVLSSKGAEFVVTVKDESEEIARKAIESTFPKATIEKVEDPFTIEPTLTSELAYHNHYFLSLRIDRRTNSLLAALLDTISMLTAGEIIYVQNLAIPAPTDWYIGAVEAYKKFKNGSLPRKVHLEKKELTNYGLRLAAKTLASTANSLVHLLGSKPEDPIDLDGWDRSQILKEGNLRQETINKARGEAFDVTIRIGVKANDTNRARDLLNMVYTAFRSLDGDNYLKDKKTPLKRTYELLKERRSSLKAQKDYMSIQEFSRLLLMPPYYLQEKYNIQNVSSLEQKLPERLLKGGMWLGEQQFRGKSEKVYFPTNNLDELCLPRVVIGGMGSGKTKGYGANWMYQAVLNGYGALCLDPAKGEIGLELKSKLPPDKIIRINIGETPISLDWREAYHSKNSKGRLANTILSFFNNTTDETGAQTSRYIRAAVMAMTSGKLSEILSILEEPKTREEAISRLSDGIHKTTLQDLHEHSDGRRRQILEPILNRFDLILGDEFLSSCFNADKGIDLVELMSQKKAIIFDVPKSIVGEEGVEIIGSLISAKIDIAMTLRKEKDQFPFFVVMDEPHQYSKSARVWKNASVESRKWRVGYVWMFHEWKQINADLRDIIKSALPHYHIYSSSKNTYKDLLDELRPLTLEDCMKTKTHYAINSIRSGGDYIKPFVAKMAPPPSMQ
jgi:hypothetical protein